MMDKLLGKKIGKGFRRDVFEHKEDDSLVIKALLNKTDKHNINEIERWKNADEETKKYLAPCIEISEDGVYLIQKKGTKVEGNGYIPTRDFPESFIKTIKPFQDRIKKDNWVYIDGELKLCDYGEEELTPAQERQLKRKFG